MMQNTNDKLAQLYILKKINRAVGATYGGFAHI